MAKSLFSKLEEADCHSFTKEKLYGLASMVNEIVPEPDRKERILVEIAILIIHLADKESVCLEGIRLRLPRKLEL